MGDLTGEVIRRFEGYARRLPTGDCAAYLCSAGVPTIGWGSTGPGVRLGTVWTREQAERRFDADTAAFALGVYAISPSLAAESAGRQAAIVSFAYNCGLTAYRHSALRRAVDRGDWEEAKRQLMRWTRAGGRVVRGLENRRRAECALIDA